MTIAKMDHLRELVLALLRDKNTSYFINLAKYVGDISAVDESQASYFIDNGILEEFDIYLGMCKKADKIVIAWVLSNFAANSPRDSESIAMSSILYKLMLLLNDKNYDLRKEAMWTLNNLCLYSEKENVIEHLVHSGLV